MRSRLLIGRRNMLHSLLSHPDCRSQFASVRDRERRGEVGTIHPSKLPGVSSVTQRDVGQIPADPFGLAQFSCRPT